MFAAEPTLTREQTAALEVFLRGGTPEEARAQANVEYATVAGWLRDPDFLAALHAARSALWQETLGRLQEGAGRAVQTLSDVMQNCNDARVRIRAAQILIQLATKAQQEEQRRAERAQAAAARAAGPHHSAENADKRALRESVWVRSKA